MLGRTYERENCSAARALELVGERWSLLIIRNAVFAGMTRFSEFERRLGIAPNVLASRLQLFVDHGLMTVDGGSYALTPQGMELGSVVIALTNWGDRWLAPQGPPVRYSHTDCAGSVRIQLGCDDCAAEIAIDEVVALPGPGASDEQRAVLNRRAEAESRSTGSPSSRDRVR